MSEKTTPAPKPDPEFIASNANYGLIVEPPPVTTKEQAQTRIMGLYQAVEFYFHQVGGINWATFHLRDPRGLPGGEEFEVMIQKVGQRTAAQMLAEAKEELAAVKKASAVNLADRKNVEQERDLAKWRADGLEKRVSQLLDSLQIQTERADALHNRCDEYAAQIEALKKQVDKDHFFINRQAAEGMARERAAYRQDTVAEYAKEIANLKDQLTRAREYNEKLTLQLKDKPKPLSESEQVAFQRALFLKMRSDYILLLNACGYWSSEDDEKDFDPEVHRKAVHEKRSTTLRRLRELEKKTQYVNENWDYKTRTDAQIEELTAERDKLIREREVLVRELAYLHANPDDEHQQNQTVANAVLGQHALLTSAYAVLAGDIMYEEIDENQPFDFVAHRKMALHLRQLAANATAKQEPK